MTLPDYVPNPTWHDGASGGTLIAAAPLNRIEAALQDASAAAHAATAGATSMVFPESYVQAGDGGNWALAIGRALAAATPLGKPVVLQTVYPVTSTITLVSGAKLVGLGTGTGLRAPTNTPLTVLQATTQTGITLDNFLVDGNCLTLATAPTNRASGRGIRFTGCTSIRVHRITTQFTSDWATSFENSQNILVTDHVHRAGQATLRGGRDGIHFLDCRDVLLDGARIHSGDDCVGITSQTRDINRITIRNVTGVSEIAAVVTLGNEASTAFLTSDLVIENVSTYTSPDYAGLSAYVVKLRAQNSSVVQRVLLSGITGTAVSHGVWLEGSLAQYITDVELVGINTVSTTNHGMLFDCLAHFEAYGLRGKSTAGLYDGVSFAHSRHGSISGGGARDCALWGLQLNTCTGVDVVAFMARDNGAANFANSTGGNGRIANCTDIYINGGQYVGAATTSYFGMSQGNNTLTFISGNTRVSGAH